MLKYKRGLKNLCKINKMVSKQIQAKLTDIRLCGEAHIQQPSKV